VGTWLSAGLVLASTRQQPGEVRWDEARHELWTTPPVLSLQLPRGYARVALGRWEVLAGTFRVGFAQRLTLDTTGRPEPDGALADVAVLSPASAASSCANADGGCGAQGDGTRATPDFRWRDGFRGLAASVRNVELAHGVTLSASGFASLAPRTLSPSELVDRARCPEPRSTNAACRAPAATVEGASEGRLARSALPGLLDEAAGGGHVSVQLGPQAHVGLTGYAAAPLWRAGAASLDVQESSRLPDGGPFGAVGVDGGLGLGLFTLLAEAARSFDSVRGRGGDVALLQRTLLSGPAEELELQLRYYGPDYDNPYARPPAAPDEEEGLRARNEAGARLALLTHQLAPWRLRGTVDVSHELRTEDGQFLPRISSSLRADGDALGGVTPTVLLEQTHRKVTEAACGAPSCGSDTLRATVRVRARLTRWLDVAVQYRHAVELAGGEAPAQGGSALLEVAARPGAFLRIRSRVRWSAPDLLAPDLEGHGATGTVEVDWRAPAGLLAHVGYRLTPDLATAPGSPGPEHRFHLDVEACW
ncbi:MAG: hypothetical protein L0Y64_20505, partial [Myxococcaceae bacterium]|nr:hypothetical protein [Myxococcaceae bacterium]